jgi:NSS family neurotransmitter:Na+ symporter
MMDRIEPDRSGAAPARPSFTSTTAAVLTMIGVAVGLGNFWRFPYLTGRFGGAAFVLFYLLIVVVIGVPGLMAEWTLGRSTGRGTAGAFQRSGLPLGRAIGWFLFIVVAAATAYYSNAVGWVLCFAISHALRATGLPAFEAARVLPPADGFTPSAFFMQVGFTGVVLISCTAVLMRGLRRGIEAASRVMVPALFGLLIALIVRGITLPGASEGVHWYLLKFRPADLTGSVMVAAMGQVVFSLSLGGTFMVVYGSYLGAHQDLRRNAVLTAGADTAAGLLAGLAIFPAVFALGLEPGSGPGLIFNTLPRVFAAMPAGTLFAALFFTALFCAALLSDIAALEVLVAGLTDNTRVPRRRAILFVSLAVMILALPSMTNMRVFVPWDLTFGSGMQTLGALLAVIAVGWALDRATVLREMARAGQPAPLWLYYWLRFAVPGCIVLVGVWWLLTDVLHGTGGV